MTPNAGCFDDRRDGESSVTAISDVRYRLASPGDKDDAAVLLAEAGLPTADVSCGNVLFLVAIAERQLVGCVGIEPHGNAGIIRSLVVRPSMRRLGIATTLVERAIALALAGNIETLFLLALDAVQFWSKRGFQPTAREAAPESIRGSTEFADLCPASAVCMIRQFAGPMVSAHPDEHWRHDEVSGSHYWELALPRVRLTGYVVPADAKFPMHSHDGDQITYVLSGELIFSGDGQERMIGAGSAILIPAHTKHEVRTGPHGAHAVDAWSHPFASYND